MFAQSARLYQQSESLADFLLATFQHDAAPFAETHALLAKAGAARLEDEAARRHAAQLAWQHLVAVGGALDARSAIPALLEAVERFYYADDNAIINEAPWLGTAMKLAIALIWANRRVVTAGVKAHAQVRRLVAAAGAWEQLKLYDDKARALELGVGEFMPDGVESVSRDDALVRLAWNASASKRGLAHRTLNDSINVIWQDPGAFLDGVAQVLDGVEPARIALFQGTVFESAHHVPDFWLGLSVRLQLMGYAARFRKLGRDGYASGIAIFESFGFWSHYLGDDKARGAAASQAAFWQREWHAPRLAQRDNLANMLVERPAIRIDERTFVTGIANIADSINCFVEYSVFRFHGYGGVPIAPEAFRQHVSQPFEERAAACFTERGWRADHVSEGGAWAGTALVHPDGIANPGEVDVLAMHPSGRLAVLVECKILSLPFTPGKALNVARKLGPADSEGFHGKLERKAAWLRAIPAFKDVVVQPLLLVDEGAFMGRNAPHPVVDVDALPALIDQWDRAASEAR